MRRTLLAVTAKLVNLITPNIEALDAENPYRNNFLFHALSASYGASAARHTAYRNGILVTTGMRAGQNNDGWFELRTKTGAPSTWVDGTWPNTGQSESSPANTSSVNTIQLAWLSDTELAAFVHGNTSGGAGVLVVYRYLWNGSAFIGRGARTQMAITQDGVNPLGGFTFRSSQSGVSRVVEVGLYNIGSLNPIYSSTYSTTDLTSNADATLNTTATVSSGNNGTLIVGLGASFDWQHTGDGVTPVQPQPYFYAIGRGAFNSAQNLTCIKGRAAFSTSWNAVAGDETGLDESNLIFNAWPGYTVTGTVYKNVAGRYHKGRFYALCSVNADANGNYVVSAVKINPREGAAAGVKMTLEHALPVRLSSDASNVYRNWAFPNRYSSMGFKVYGDRLYGLFFHKPSGATAGVASVVVVDMETGVAQTFAFTAAGDNWRSVFLSNVAGDTATEESWFPVLGGNDYTSMNLAAGVIS